MGETYDSVTDRVGAFNEATERISKGKASQVECVVVHEPSIRLRLLKTEESYSFEVHGQVPPEREGTLREMEFAGEGQLFRREVRRAERSWNVASQMEDILADVFGLPAATAVTLDVS